LLPTKEIQQNIYIKHPVSIEQYMMEGSYNKVSFCTNCQMSQTKLCHFHFNDYFGKCGLIILLIMLLLLHSQWSYLFCLVLQLICECNSEKKTIKIGPCLLK